MSTDNDDKLMADAARLAREITPERDLWPGIEARIAAPARKERRTGWWPGLAQAAAVLVLVGGSSLLTYTLMDKEPVVVERPVSDGLVLENASFGGQLEMSNGYKLARTNLQAQMDRELAKVTPETRAAVEENLAEIRGAIGEINAALEKEPNNALLQELLLKSYQEELSVMRKVGGLTQSVMSRNDI
jgi:hypothetical protein